MYDYTNSIRQYYLRLARVINQVRSGWLGWTIVFLIISRTILLLWFNGYPLGYDALSYIAAARSIWLGRSPYDVQFQNQLLYPIYTSGYLYPPLLAILLIPISFLSFQTASHLCVIGSATFALVLILLLQKNLDWKLATFGVLVFPPVWHSIYLGQVNLLIAVILASAFFYINTDRFHQAGALLALGAVIKITPILNIYVLIRKYRWRGISVFILILLLTMLISAPFVSIFEWFKGTVNAFNQSWASPEFVSWTGLLSYWFGKPGEIAGVVVSILLLIITLFRIERLPLYFAVSVTSILPLLIARITWEHHAVIVLPVFALIWEHMKRFRFLIIFCWVLIALGGGWIATLSITLFWAASCWPGFSLKSGLQS